MELRTIITNYEEKSERHINLNLCSFIILRERAYTQLELSLYHEYSNQHNVHHHHVLSQPALKNKVKITKQ